MMRDVGTTIKGLLVFIAAYAIIQLLTPLLTSLVSDGKVSVVVEAEISEGTAVEAFFNGDWAHPAAVAIQPKKKIRYPLVYQRPSAWFYEPLTQLRIDITDAPGALVKLHSITVRDAGRKRKIVGAALAATAGRSGISDVQIDGTAATFKAATNDAFLQVSPELEGAPVGKPEQILWFVRGNLVPIVLLITGVALCIVQLTRREFSLKERTWGVSLPLIFGGALPLLLILLASLVPPAPFYQGVELAVGNGVYSGYPKVSEYSLLYLLVGVSIAFGVLLGALYRLSAGRAESAVRTEYIAETQQPRSAWLAPAWAVFGVLILALSLRDIAGGIESIQASATQFDYDSLNIETWNYLYQVGYLPFKDFWFPYGFSSFAMGRTPLALVAMSAHCALLYIVLAGSLFIILDKRLLWSVCCVLGVIALEATGSFRGVYRYFISLDLVVLCGAVFLRSPTRVGGFLFGLFGAYGTIFEPSQSLYAAPACSIILLYSLIRGYLIGALSRTLQALLTSIAIGGTIIAGFLVSLASTDQLDGLVRTYSRLGSSAVSSTVAGEMKTWLSNPLTPEGMVLVGSLFLLSVGVFSISRASSREKVNTWFVVLGIGITTMCIFGKHLVRPHMANQFLGLIFVGGVVVVWGACRDLNRTQRFLLVAGFGALCSALSGGSKAWELLESAISAPHKIGRGVQVLAAGRDTGRAAYEALFSQGRLSPVYPIIPALSMAREEVAHTAGMNRDFFVLGDEAFLYNVFRQKPPPFISLYNSSDVRDQADIVTWLETNRPSIVVSNSGALFFDGVPNVVRVPLLYKYVMTHYRFYEEAGGFWLLVRREAPVFDDRPWVDRLGTELDLGALPSLSTIGQRPLCRLASNETSCRPVLHISRRGPEADEAKTLVLVVSQRGTEYTLLVRALASREDLFVRLDRLWFVNDQDEAFSAGLRAGATGTSVQVEGRLLPDDLLY